MVGFKLKGLDMVTGFFYSYDFVFAYLRLAEADKSDETGGGLVAGWLGLEFIDSFNLCLNCSIFGCAKMIYTFCFVLELPKILEVPDGVCYFWVLFGFSYGFDTLMVLVLGFHFVC